MRVTQFTHHAETSARGLAIALGFSIPISVALDNILLGLILAAWLASGNFRDKFATIKASPVALAALMLFGLMVLGLAHGARNPGDGLLYLGKYLDLLFVPVFVTVFQNERTRAYALKAFCCAIVLSIVVSHLALHGLLINNPILPREQLLSGGFKFSITHSLLVGFGAFAFALMAHATNDRVWRMGLIGLALIAAHNVLFTVISRTGYLVFAVLMLYFAVAAFRWRGVAVAAALGVAVFFTAYVSADRFYQRMNDAAAELSDWRPDKPSDTSIGLRMEFFRGSLQIIREHPLLGAGTGSFPAAYAATVTGKPMEKSTNPHNEYLLIASQIGLIGLACLILLFCLQWRLAAAITPTIYRDLGRGLVLVFAIGCLFNSLLLDHTEGLLFAWASGLIFAGQKTPAIGAIPTA